jgi:hypothetical protein
VTQIGIIGRSMGAATAVSVAGSPPYSSIIAGMVLDSCYTSVEKVVTEVIMKKILFCIYMLLRVVARRRCSCLDLKACQRQGSQNAGML